MARRLALLIGNGKFDDSEFDPLPATANDVADMGRVLSEYGDFEIMKPLIDADHQTISDSIEELYTTAKYGDLTLLYYSGHGYLRGAGKLSLTARNTTANGTKTVRDTSIRDGLNESHAKHHVLILDCCYSGAILKGQKSVAEPITFKALNGESIICFCSSGSATISHAPPGERNSLFTKYLLDGIEEGRADSKGTGFIFPNELNTYTRDLVNSAQLGQTPHYSNNIRGKDFYLTRNPKIDEATRLLPKNLLASLEDGDRWMREAAVKRLGAISKGKDSEMARVAKVKLEERLGDESRRVRNLAQKFLDVVSSPSTSSVEQVDKPPIKPAPQLLNAEPLFSVSKPAWAKDYGQDKYGIYADLVVNNVTQRFRFIQPGEFMMGSPKSEPERFDGEVLHKVRLTQGYWLADSACTQALWKAVMKDNPSHFKGDELPVERVSWKDTQTFLESLNTQLGKPVFRLPTEAEWEYACRAGTETPFSFENTITSEQVNFNGNYPYNKSKKSTYREQTVPAKSLPCNDWGLYEMHGNVWEWCKDCYGPYDTSKSVVINPEGPPSGADRVLRGGSWFNFAWYCRSALRFRYSPELRNFYFGFRFASGHPS